MYLTLKKMCFIKYILALSLTRLECLIKKNILYENLLYFESFDLASDKINLKEAPASTRRHHKRAQYVKSNLTVVTDIQTAQKISTLTVLSMHYPQPRSSSRIE